MNVTVIPTVVGAIGFFSKGLKKKTERVETIQTKELLAKVKNQYLTLE